MRLFITIFSLLFSYQLSAEIYTWQDKNGVTHFSENKPASLEGEMKDLQEAKVNNLNVISEEYNEQKTTKPLDVNDKFNGAHLAEH